MIRECWIVGVHTPIFMEAMPLPIIKENIMNPYEKYETNEDHEKNGKWMDEGSFRILIARAGGSNSAAWFKAYNKALEKLGKVTGTLTDEEAEEMMLDIHVDAIIKDHEILDDDGKWQQGLFVKKDNKVQVVPFSKKDMKTCLKDLPELFNKIKEKAQAFETFKAYSTKEQEKN